MFSNPFVAQLVAEERRQDDIRRAEKARLVRASAGAGQPRRWSRQLVLALKNWWPRFDDERVLASKMRSLPEARPHRR